MSSLTPASCGQHKKNLNDSVAQVATDTVEIIKKYGNDATYSPIFHTPPVKVITHPLVNFAINASESSNNYKNTLQQYGNPTLCTIAESAKVATTAIVTAVGSAMTATAIASHRVIPSIAAVLAASGVYVCNRSDDVGKAVHQAIMSSFVKPTMSSSSSSLSSSSSVSSDYGGVKLNDSLDFDKLLISTSSSQQYDPVDITDDGLIYRGVIYQVPDVSPEELATIMFVVFFDDPADIGVSLDRDNNDRLERVFKPPMMVNTLIGRTMMEADEILKQYLCKHFYNANEEHDGEWGLRAWFEPYTMHVQVEKEKREVVFHCSEIQTVYATSDGKENPTATEFVTKMNNEYSHMSREHVAFRSLMKYTSLVRLCRLLASVSNHTITTNAVTFIQNHLHPIANDTLYPMTVDPKDMGEMQGGITMLVEKLSLGVPWRIGNKNDNRVCDRCGWTIEVYMEASFTGERKVICKACRIALGRKLFQLPPEALRILSPNEAEAVVMRDTLNSIDRWICK